MEGKKYVAKTLQGIEEVLEKELISYGAKNVKAGRRMLEFEADEKTMYSINYRVATAIRILQSFHSFEFNDINEFYDNLFSLKWEDIISPSQTIAIDASVSNSELFNNSHFTELKAKDAIVDYFRDKFGIRPSVNKENPALLVNIFVNKNFCHVSLDTSGTPLYKRGYREVLHEASINEVLAAGMIRLSEWNGEGDFYDPMCGAGTIAIEAKMFATKMPAGYFRENWGFMNWKTYNAELWKEVVAENKKIEDNKNHSIYASDISSEANRLARKNLARARMINNISLEKIPFEQLKPKNEKGILIFNPPYNVRIEVEDIISFYQNIGNHLKHNFKGHDAWIISSDKTAIKHIGLKPSKKIILFNGPLESYFYKFSCY